MCDLNNPIFTDADAARKHLESVIWPDGPVCPHCGSVEGISKVRGRKKSHRPGLYYCNACKGTFTVTVGTVFERSKVPLNKWLLATHLLCSSKKGMSAHQIHRMLGVTYKTAWFMAHRIREAMREIDPAPMGGGGKTVEADETYIGNTKAAKRRDVLLPGKGWVQRGGGSEKLKVVSLVERGGRARSVHVRSLTTNSVGAILRQNVVRKTTKLMTDKANIYKAVGREFLTHESVDHGKYEWSRGTVHTNTIEGFFSIFKRGMRGVYQHCSEAHLQRYLHEFDFRYSNNKITDAERTGEALKGIIGKRLTYRRTSEAAYA